MEPCELPIKKQVWEAWGQALSLRQGPTFQAAWSRTPAQHPGRADTDHRAQVTPCLSPAGILVAHYLQSITPCLALGGELVYHRRPGEEGAVMSLAGKYTCEPGPTGWSRGWGLGSWV